MFVNYKANIDILEQKREREPRTKQEIVENGKLSDFFLDTCGMITQGLKILIKATHK